MVLVGDTSVGKTCLIHNYLHNAFSEEYEPTVLDVYKGTKNVKGKQIEIEIHDTSGDEQLGVNRKTQYQGGDVFMICVAVNNQDSLTSVGRWKNEIKEEVQNAPIVLVLTKKDLAEFVVDDVVTDA